MNYSNFRFTLNMHNHRSQVTIPVFYGDTGIRLYINITDGGVPYIIEDGCVAVLRGMKADGNPIVHYCFIENNATIVYDFKEQTTSCSGLVDCEINLYGKDGKLITAPKFVIVVGDRVATTDEILSEADRDALDALFLSEASRAEAESARVIAETARADAEVERLRTFKTVFVRYSAHPDGTDYTETWSAGQDYIGIATSPIEPTDKSGYVWHLARGEQGEQGEAGGVSLEYANTTFANSPKATVRGNGFTITDISPVTHTLKAKVIGSEDPTTTHVFVKDDATTAGEWVEYAPNADGTVDGITSLYPQMTIHVDSAVNEIEVEYNRDINKALHDPHDPVEVVQETGTSTDKVMSQKAVTDALSPIVAKTSGYREKGINLVSLDMASPKGEWWYNGVKYTSGNASTDASCSFKIPVDPNTTYYTRSYSAEDKTSAFKTASYLSWFDESGNFISSPSLDALLKIISPENASYAMVTFRIYENASDTEVSYLPYMSSVDAPEVFPPEGEEITFETLQADINELKENSVVPEKSSTATLHLPEQYSLVVGDTFELFYKGIINAVNTDLFHIEIECAKGNPFKKRYIFTPTADNIGTLPMTIKLFDLHHNLLDTKSVNLVVKAKAASPTTEKTVLYVTDSLGNSGYVPDEFNRRLVGSGGNPTADALSNISFIGTCKSLNNGVRYEGYGGWSLGSYNVENKSSAYMWVTTTHDKTADDQHSTYKDSNGILWKLETIEANRIKLIRVSTSGTLPASGTLTWNAEGVNHTSIVYTASEQASGNPFWNEEKSAVDFANYVTKQGKTTLDFVYVLLGWNSHPISISNYKNAAKTFINNILTAYPNCKIVLLGLQIPSQDGIALNYGANGAYSNYFDLINHVWSLNELYAEIAAEYDNVSFVNVCGQFDTENNMSSGSRTVNVRNSTTETYQTNGVHPAPSGYYQIADACYRDFIHKLQI